MPQEKRQKSEVISVHSWLRMYAGQNPLSYDALKSLPNLRECAAFFGLSANKYEEELKKLFVNYPLLNSIGQLTLLGAEFDNFSMFSAAQQNFFKQFIGFYKKQECRTIASTEQLCQSFFSAKLLQTKYLKDKEFSLSNFKALLWLPFTASKSENEISQDLRLSEVNQIFNAELPQIAEEHRTKFYSAINDSLLISSDALRGIKTSIRKDAQGKEYWYCDASDVDTLDNIDQLKIDKHNLLLRCLSRLRSIDYAIGAKHPNDFGSKLRCDLHKHFNTLLALVPVEDDVDSLTQLEAEFDTNLLKTLHKANLTHALRSKSDAEKILCHYRNLSSLLDPTRAIVAETKIKNAGKDIALRETYYPVTEKIKEQIDSITLQYNKKAYYASATYEADHLFYDLMCKNDRELPAQTRKTHMVGVKNAFITKYELMVNQQEESNPLWLARSGSPVYLKSDNTWLKRLLFRYDPLGLAYYFIGDAVHDAMIAEHARLNIEQIRTAAKKYMGKDKLNNIHITVLNTDTVLERQDIIIKNIREVFAQRSGDAMSHAPTNFQGVWTSGLTVAPNLGEIELFNTIGSKVDRVKDAATIALQASELSEMLSLIICASGQDRTGTVTLQALIFYLHDKLVSTHDLTSDEADRVIDQLLLQSSTSAKIASYLVPGSPGMKHDSSTDGLFSSELTQRLYLASANTNKSSPVLKDELAFLRVPCLDSYEFYKETSTDSQPFDRSKPYDKLLSEIDVMIKKYENIPEVVNCLSNLSQAIISGNCNINQWLSDIDLIDLPIKQRIMPYLVNFIIASCILTAIATVPMSFGLSAIPLSFVAGLALLYVASSWLVHSNNKRNMALANRTILNNLNEKIKSAYDIGDHNNPQLPSSNNR